MVNKHSGNFTANRTCGSFANQLEPALKILFLFVVLFSLWSPMLFSQEANYRIDVRYIQRLTWVGDQYAMRYEVIVDKNDNGNFTQILRESTVNQFIEVSLPPGKYRYQVIPHDFFGAPIPVTDWIDFDVLKADHSITGSDGLMLAENRSDTGHKFDIYLGAAYLPVIPVYNDKLFLGNNMTFIGAGVKAAVVSANQNYLSPGAELTASMFLFDEAQSITIELNFLAQMRFLNGRTALNFRSGFGISLISGMQNTTVPKLDVFYINTGISFFALVTRNIYIEAGIDSPQFISADHFGYLRPWIGIGVRL